MKPKQHTIEIEQYNFFRWVEKQLHHSTRDAVELNLIELNMD